MIREATTKITSIADPKPDPHWFWSAWSESKLRMWIQIRIQEGKHVPHKKKSK
jgi:hypothetical protein